jgi:hypothetical protein
VPYVKVPRVYRIVFDPVSSPDTTVPGLEILSRALKFGEVFGLTEFGALSGQRLPTAEDRALFSRGIGRMIESLISWDMTEADGTPVPLTAEGFDSLDFLQGVEILNEWIDVQMGNVSDPKARSSENGQAPAPDIQIPMETL